MGRVLGGQIPEITILLKNNKNMKKIIKSLGKIPTIYWGLGMIVGNVIMASFNNITGIIVFNSVGIVLGVLGIVSRHVK